MAEHTEAIWAAARVLHEAGCSVPGCAHGNPDVEQGDLDLAEDVMAAAAPRVAAAERERIAALAEQHQARYRACRDGDHVSDNRGDCKAWAHRKPFADLIRDSP